ncbi:hypothetical protein C0Q70_03563 [Pomacea canaliculata]|uniref:Uncharacterized protein n=1 Tax=Pomacea canaliculata TaxID=400727 RepID=A0A2T7PT27_POMCA|nr:hypothetical protein C0Q70_03563 [Pomacea canaliculata]
MVTKSENVAMQEQKQYFQRSLLLKHPLAERSEGKYEHMLKMNQLQKRMQQERQTAMEPGRKVRKRRRSGRLDSKEGHGDMFDARENPTIHHLARGRWENKVLFISFKTKGKCDVEPSEPEI